jgi:hypothetical protein
VEIVADNSKILAQPDAIFLDHPKSAAEIFGSTAILDGSSLAQRYGTTDES